MHDGYLAGGSAKTDETQLEPKAKRLPKTYLRRSSVEHRARLLARVLCLADWLR
jgi:hypothetical protein